MCIYIASLLSLLYYLFKIFCPISLGQTPNLGGHNRAQVVLHNFQDGGTAV